jgi:hypothetical protein
MKIAKFNFRSLIDYIPIFILIYISSGYQLSVYSGHVRLSMHLALVFLLIICNLRQLKHLTINRLSTLILLAMLCNIVLTTLINSEGFNQILITTAFLLTAFIFTVYYKIDNFLSKYIDIMVFLCMFSLIIYFIAIVFPQLVMYLPITQNNLGLPSYNAFFSTIHINERLIRNQGFFWEPGAFQTYINLALIFNLFVFKQNYKRNLVIFGVTLFTTFSTTGYIVGLIIIFAFVLHLFAERKEQKKTLGFMLIIVVLLVSGIIVYNDLSENAKYQTFGKVGYFFEGGNSSSTSTRIEAIIYPVMYFLNNPVFGNGTLGMSEIASDIGYNMNTCTVVNWFAMFGIFMGISMNYGLYRLCQRFQTAKIIKLFLFFAVLLSLFSENYVRNSSILVFVFYGYHRLNRVKVIKNISHIINSSMDIVGEINEPSDKNSAN